MNGSGGAERHVAAPPWPKAAAEHGGVHRSKQASAAKDERVRKVLMGAARLWMETALEVERSSGLVDEDEP